MIRHLSLARIGALASGIALAGTVRAQVTTRASLASDGSQFAEACDGPSISADGRRVVFRKGLYLDDIHQYWDVFVHDRVLGTTDLVSVSMGGGPGNASSGGGAISDDGRYVAFMSAASDLVPGDTNGMTDVFVRDLQTGAIERASVSSGGSQANDTCWYPSLSADGRFVLFHGGASNLVPGDTSGDSDVFLRDRVAGTTERVSLTSAGGQANGGCFGAAISPDGRWIVFYASATNLVPGDTNGLMDVFLRDRQLGTTERVSVATGGTQGNGMSNTGAVSADGRYVAFSSGATNLVPGDTNGTVDVFLRDRSSQTTDRISVGPTGVEGNSFSGVPWLSADGRLVAFYSAASNLVPGDTNGWEDVFLTDRRTNRCERLSVDSQGLQGDGPSFRGGISPDGRYASFWSFATNLVPGDTNGRFDVFVRDRHASGFTSLCDPGASGVIGCPCSNPPAGPGRGCDNSSATGGASLSASGAAYLTMDSLAFTTSGEKPTSLSLVLQGDRRSASGIVFGQGVRCLDGALKRLYVKLASGGSITAPDLASGDPPVSVRSASLGDPLQPGASRGYLVYYRDPVVLGGCPGSSTFNATQTGRVEWWP